MGCCVCVPEDKLAMITKFDKFERVAEPGCHCLFPCIVMAKGGEVLCRVLQMDTMVDTRSKDNVFVKVKVAIQYEVIREKAQEAFYKLEDPSSQISAYVYDVVRSEVPLMTIDEVFVLKNQIADRVRESLRATMDDYGYTIHDALVVDIDPEQNVKAAMNEIEASRRLRIANNFKADADKITMIKRAEAESEAKFLQGAGISKQRQALVNGLKSSVTGFTDQVSDVSPKKVLELVLMTQYFDTLKELSAGGSVVFTQDADVVRDGMMQAQAIRR